MTLRPELILPFLLPVLAVKVLVLQPDGVPNKDAAILHLAQETVSQNPGGAAPEGWESWEGIAYTYSLTLCLWTKTTYFRPKPSPISYGVSSLYINEIYSDISPTQVGFAFFSSFFSGKAKINIEEWYHLCLWYDHNQTLRRVYLNGQPIVEELFTAPRPLFLNGSFVLAQEQDDYPGGGFDWYQSFAGQLAALQIWTKPLSEDEIKILSNCHEDTKSDLLDWESTPWELSESATWQDIPIAQMCEPLKRPLLIFPELRTMAAAERLCEVVGGALPIPHNSAENSDLSVLLEDHKHNCGRRIGLWLGASDKEEEGVWRSIASGETLSFLPFAQRQPDGLKNENCLLLDFVRNGWSDWSCSVANTFCTACIYSETQEYVLRGLCETDTARTVFSLRGYENERPYWRGLYNYHIKYYDSHWVLHDLWSNTTLATLEVLSTTKYPYGINNWVVLKEKAICSTRPGEQHMLSLTRCLDGSFTCSDGSCVPESQRCDLRNHCSDGSDEDGCHNTITPMGYRPNLPPPPIEENASATPMLLLVQVERFSKIDTLNMEVSLDYTVELSWLDPRLTYSNLKPPPKVNVVQIKDDKKVWLPQVSYPTGNGVMRLRQETFTAKRLGDAEPDDVSQPIQDKVYNGKNASLVLMWKIHMPFTCNMKLLYYPFDVQICVIPIVMASASVEYLSFVNPVAEYLGDRALTEVMVGFISVEVRNTTGDSMSSVIVSVELRRRYAFFMTSTYFPTMLLLLVGYGTLYIRLPMFQVRSIMSLTTLLVLTSLYTQTAASLPKTSYLKAIDLWLLYCIITLVVIIVSHVFTDFVAEMDRAVMNTCRTFASVSVWAQRRKSVTKVLPAKSPPSSADPPSEMAAKHLGPALIHLMRILVPISFIVFNLFYWLFVAGLI